MKDYYDEMEKKTLIELAEEMNRVRVKLDAANDVKVNLQKKYDALRLNLIPGAMDADGVTSLTVKGIGRLGITSDIYASIPAENRKKAWVWLRKNKLGDIIKETINAGTLKATLKGIMKRGELDIPSDIFKVTPFSRASITKK